MEEEEKNINKPMFLIGIAMVVIAVILFLTVKELEMWPVPIGIIGIGLIASSRYRLIK